MIVNHYWITKLSESALGYLKPICFRVQSKLNLEVITSCSGLLRISFLAFLIWIRLESIRIFSGCLRPFSFHCRFKFVEKYISICSGLAETSLSIHGQLEFTWRSSKICFGLPTTHLLAFSNRIRLRVNLILLWLERMAGASSPAS